MAARSDPKSNGARPTGHPDASSSAGATVASAMCDVLGYRTPANDTQGFIAARIDAPFLGTQLVLLSRQLEIVSETVIETYCVMDSGVFGTAARQAVLLRLTEVTGQLASQLNRAVDFADAVFERLGLNIDD